MGATMRTNTLFSTALILSCLALAACGGGTSSPPTASSKISGVVSKGPIKDGTVQVFAVRNGVEDRTAPIAQGVTDANGNFSIDVGSLRGQVMVEATGGSFTDEVSGATVTLKTPLQAVFTNASSGTKTVAVTPLTDLASKLAKKGSLTRKAIDDANARMASKFGLTDIVSTLPSAGSASADRKKYAAACGSISQLANNSSRQSGKRLDDALTEVMSQMESEVEHTGDLSDDSTTKLNTAIDDFNRNGKNSTGAETTHVEAPHTESESPK
jgi:hypothetical protein